MELEAGSFVYSVEPTMKALPSLLLSLLAFPAFALTTEEVQKLAQAGLSDEVILAQIQAEKASFVLDVEGILALKRTGVSDRVIQAMIASRPEQGKDRTVSFGRLEIANDTDRPLVALLHPAARTVFLCHGRMKDEFVLEGGASRILELAPGTWAIRWVGEKDCVRAGVAVGESTRAVATRLTTESLDALQVTVFEGERETGSGVVKTFASREARRPEFPEPQAAFYVPMPMPVYGVQSISTPAPTRREAPLIGRWTLLGSAAGAVIGHQSDSRDKGLALGAVLGHILDHMQP